MGEGDRTPSSPLSRLHSPEPSGTPVLKCRSSYRPPGTSFCLGREPAVSTITIEEKWEHSFKSGSAESFENHRETDAMQAEYDICTWNPYASDSERQPKLKCYEEVKHGQVSTDASYQKDQSPDSSSLKLGGTQTWSSLPTLKKFNSSKSVPPEIIKSFPNEGGQSEATALQNRFADLFQKVSGANVDDAVSSISIPAQQIGYLQKKIHELQMQLADEKRQRQIAAQRLAEERQETEKSTIERQELWEAKLKELQKEKYTLTIRLQELEVATPRKRITKGEDAVVLTGQELKCLKQEIWEQESLIRGYQLENQKAVEKMKELQLEAKEKQRLMGEENAALASQLANMQLSVRQSLSHVSVGNSTPNPGLEAHARELKLRLENEKLMQVISDLERSISDMKKNKERESRQYTHEVNNQDLINEKMDLTKKIEQQAALITELESKLQDYQKLIQDRPGTAPAESSAPLVPENGQASSRKFKRATEQVAEVRSFYIKKIKDLTKKLEEAGQDNNKKAEQEIIHSQANAANSAHVKEIRQLKEQMSRLNDTINSQAIAIHSLKDKLENVKDTKEHDGQQRVKVKSSNTKQKQQMKAESPATLVQEVEEKTKMEAMEEQNKMLEQRLKEISQELFDLQSTPRMLELKFLKERIEEMEEYYKQKEIEWHEILKETKRLFGIEQDMIERKWELALDTKNAEVERFRLELDTILETALKIQASQLQAVHGQENPLNHIEQRCHL